MAAPAATMRCACSCWEPDVRCRRGPQGKLTRDAHRHMNLHEPSAATCLLRHTPCKEVDASMVLTLWPCSEQSCGIQAADRSASQSPGAACKKRYVRCAARWGSLLCKSSACKYSAPLSWTFPVPQRWTTASCVHLRSAQAMTNDRNACEHSDACRAQRDTRPSGDRHLFLIFS